VGFGFHRYSTDGQWLVPHFEKMLYDQALMAMAFTEAYQAAGKEEYAKTTQEILEHVRRDMTSPEGGFFSAQDADSEGEEGKFYVWTAQELKEVLDRKEFRLLIRMFDVHENGNFEKGRNILRKTARAGDVAAVMKISEIDIDDRLEKMRCKLFAARERRVHPQKDELILADWNGLMIAALAKAAQVLQDEKLEKAAQKAADFILEKMQTREGRLLHRYREEAAVAGHLDDYAFFVWGLLELYETVFDIKYLKAAMKLTSSMMQHFWDRDHGGFFFSADDAEALPLRRKEYYDGAIPSGNSVALLNLLRLMHLLGGTDWQENAWQMARDFYAAAGKDPLGHFMMLSSLDYALGPSSQIALLGCLKDEGTIEILKALRSRFLPNKTVLLVCGEDICQMAPFTRNLRRLPGKAAAYVCTGQTCSLAASTPEETIQLLEKDSRRSQFETGNHHDL
jgi:uncharacterized protein YyaL (SSP411 family)